MAPTIQRITESCLVGEGPHWDVKSQSLYFVDVAGKSILKYNAKTNQLTKASCEPKHPSFIIPIEDQKDQFLITLNNELTIISWDGTSETFAIIATLATADAEKPGNRFNDGKCDSLGRLWAGTFGSSTGGPLDIPPIGTLFSFDTKHQLTSHVTKVRASNGLAFNDKVNKFYYIDTLEGTIDQFDFDVNEGKISNRRIFFTFSKHNIPGFPDGMTIDTDGNLWVAAFGSRKVLKIDGSNSEVLLDSIELPAIQVTSVAFGGPNLDELYVTTASVPLLQEEPLETPANGATYVVTGTGSKGLPGVNFKL